jgi:SAM-dependent methyltransferase
VTATAAAGTDSSAKKGAMTKDDQSSASYDRLFAAGGYEGIYDLPYQRNPYLPLFRAVRRRLRRPEIHSILEVGCGSGAFAHYLLETTKIGYRGFDFSPIAIEKAIARTRRPDVFSVADAIAPASYATAYDAIVCTEVLEHVPDDHAVVTQWGRGSFCICSVPNFDADNHERFFRAERDVMARYESLIEIDEIARIKKPVVSNLSLRVALREIRWNRYRPRQIVALLGLGAFDTVGGWFIFSGRRK